MSRLRAIWHILRGHTVMYRTIVNYGPREAPRFVLACYRGSSLRTFECEFAGWEPVGGESKETRKEAVARMESRPHVVDGKGNRWDTTTW